MQKVKRKSGDEGAPEIKKKKVQFEKPENDQNEQSKKKFDGKFKKDFKKDGPKVAKKFNKPGDVKGKSNFSKDKKFVKQNVSKDKAFKENSTGEKPKWSEMKKEKKHLRIVRRKAKASAEVFEISHKAKMLAAQIQRKSAKQEFRMNSCKELHCLLKGQYKTIALTHDLSRVIQVLLKHSPEDIKNAITEEVLDIMVQMAQSKYAHHAVKRILKYGTDFIRHEVLKKFLGHIVSLATHTVSAPVLDYAYGEFASNKEKIHMQQEFYGDIYKNTKDDKVKKLSDAYKGSPEMKAAILQSCKANIQRVLDKNLHDGELLHSVLYDYMRECSADERAELIATLSPLIVPLSNSLPGADAASMCVWQGTNKDKKMILKVLKEHAVPLSKHKTGYRLLVAVFDSVDDTVLVRKAIVSALAANLKDIAQDHWGNKTLHWLIKPKDTAAFHPTFLKFLEEGAKSGTSKKDAGLRVTELREAVLPALTKSIEAEPEFWLSSKINMLLAVAVMSIESSKEILDALSRVICRADWRTGAEGGGGMLAVEDAGMHMCLKKLAALDRGRGGCTTLGEAVGRHLQEETIKLWLPTNRGCFFLLNLIKNNDDQVSSKLVKKIKPHESTLEQQTSQGAKLLLQSVQNK